jgi:hypothetical protein
MNSSLRFFSFCLISSVGAALAHGAVIFKTDFSASDGYSLGALPGEHPDWTFSEGANTQWIVQADSTSPSAPSSLTSGRHPQSPSGGSNLLWISPRTSDVSAGQQATLTFASDTNRLQEPFTLSFDVFASPTGGSGQSMTINLSRANAITSTTAPQISFSSVNVDTFNLNVRSAGEWNNGVVTLDKATWLRFELSVNASESKVGTYTTSVYRLDGSGSVVETLYTGQWDYDLSQGFDAMRILTNSSRTDYWFDNITVSTAAIPEPKTASIILGAAVMAAAAGRRAR